MILALYEKFPFILDRNLAKENQVCTSCDTVVFEINIFLSIFVLILIFLKLYFGCQYNIQRTYSQTCLMLTDSCSYGAL